MDDESEAICAGEDAWPFTLPNAFVGARTEMNLRSLHSLKIYRRALRVNMSVQ